MNKIESAYKKMMEDWEMSGEMIGCCMKDKALELERELTAVTEQRDRLAEALRKIKNELGVPQPEYPAPVANAVKIATTALQSLTPNEL
jgi:hypothetical protein